MKPVLSILLLIAATQATAQLPDPTRPPGASADGAAVAGVATETGVQAVFLRHGAKPAALINGEYVVQGGKIGDRRVQKITETEVVLRDAAGNREVMRVIAEAAKTPVAEKVTAARKKRNSGAAMGAADEGATTK
ncbi:MAG: hypothetical protein KJ787_06165 [Gammaproteobacteria bacterium]|nr:hypothetical protein [Gammaproteobacteria bacterium]MBU1645899.1 hypothetical protein [Gammaproteobacteria bacterium]MBU1971961.1 hypothetical protein [Gammaproteobacteria bacterium]